MPPLEGSRRIIAMTFVMRKLEWFSYKVVKKIEDMITGFDRIHERDGQTDTARRHRPRLHSIARQKLESI